MKIQLQSKRTLFALVLIVGILLALGGSSFGATVSGPDFAPMGAATCTVFQPAKGAGQDAFIQLEKPTDNKGTDNELKVKTESGKLIRSVLKFDVTGLPAGALVESATLSLWVKDVKDGNASINAHALTKTWDQSTVTWNSPWTTPGGNYGSTISTTAFTKSVKDYWATWDVTSVASAWLNNPASNFGLILEQGVTDPKSEVKFKSNNESSDRPKLEICWRPGVTIDPNNAGQGDAGVTSSYAHVVEVGGLTNEVVNLTAVSNQGWTTRIYADNSPKDGVKDNNTPITQTPPMGPNASYGIVVEIDVPGGTPNGTRDTTTVTATGQNSGISDSATDTTNVGLPAFTEPVVDGKIDDAYFYNPYSTIQDYCSADGAVQASLMTTYDVDDPSYNDIYIVLAMSRAMVDNTYGANTHPSWAAAGKSHSLGNLEGSDKAQFDLYDGNNTLLYSPLMDYVESGLSTPSGWGSGGITDGEGSADGLNPAYFVGETSEGYNLNLYCPGGLAGCSVGGVDLENDSPPTDAFYNPTNPIFNNWEFTYLYEFSVDPAAFGAAGFGKVTIPYTHVSPNKVGSNEIPVEPCTGSIGDRVWQDLNGDGIQQPGEPGLNGVQVQLYKDNGDGVFDANTDLAHGTRLTSGNGNYDFTGLGPKTYWVRVNETTVPGGFVLTTNNNPLKVTLASGQDYNDADFGYRSTAEITIEKTLESEPPLFVGGEVVFNIRITTTGGTTAIDGLPLQDLYDPTELQFVSATPQSDDNVNDGVIDWPDLTQAAPNGFGVDLAPGAHFDVQVRFIALAQTTTVAAAAAQIDPNAFSAPAMCTAPFNNSVYTTTSNCKCTKPDRLTVRYLGAGPTTITIGGDGTGGPFTNVNTGDTFVITVTGNEPTFTATGQPAQAIHTSCSAPLYPGWTSRPAGQDKTTQGGPFEVVSFSTGGVPFVLANPASCTLGSIGDRVFIGDTIPDNGSETGVAGVTVKLYGGNCPSDPAKLTLAGLIKTTTTNGSGNYSFSGLMPGEYCATIDNGTLPVNYKLDTAAPLDAASNSDTVLSCDFGVGLVGASSIGDRVFYDVDGSGLPDGGVEPGINGVTVNLYQGVCPGSGQPFRFTETSGNGDYDFMALPAGNYCVNVDENTLPAGVSLTTGNEPLAVNLGQDQDYNGADFGYRVESPEQTCDLASVSGALDEYGSPVPPVADEECASIGGGGSIGDYVWNDANGNGLQDDGPGLGFNGVTVRLYREDGDNVCNIADQIPANFVKSAVTAGDGDYLLTGLGADVYCVSVDRFTLPGGYEFIPGLQSGPDPLLVDLGPQENYTDADFGYAGRGNITGVVFWDWNENGIQDLGEDGIPGVRVCLYQDVDRDRQFNDGIDLQISCQLSGNDPGSEGFYNFVNNLPGDDVVVQDPIPGLDSTTGRIRALTLIVIGATGS
ncbi:MAG: DNRLRE domain-containing protein, partial [Caldilineales bacterium]|nr:DNRLRE domain-containing protein [Caldilineales bacterium]